MDGPFIGHQEFSETIFFIVLALGGMDTGPDMVAMEGEVPNQYGFECISRQ
jgi:hypothetical protein